MKIYRGRKQFFALKVDLSKAFDRLEWYFLRQTMLAFGYNEDSVSLIMGCINVSYSVNINSIPKGNFNYSKGIRQRCPSSPFLFILVMEVFSRQLHQAREMGLIQGIKIERHVEHF